ncbi:jg4055 [Pararge aegeria aegeria]|uniref:Jg4055 protein n=1 Tax=Pararge aegeria aegeria TaxID=348720 RepID=A0A8S4RB67_9NEOP|nr:jg4055 [Pararge aegeria aegeria]
MYVMCGPRWWWLGASSALCCMRQRCGAYSADFQLAPYQVVSRHAARGWEQGLCAMSHTPIGGHPQGWEHKLADRSSLPPAPGEEKSKSQARHVFAQPHLSKAGMASWREETEGSSGSSARSPASPPYLRWARTLHHLLEDAEGVRLFRKFVGGAGGLHVDRLNFYFAVQGLRQEVEPAKIRQVVSAIYKFLRKSQLAMPEELKQRVKQGLKDGANIEKTIFDNMEQEVTRAITESTYQSFLRSDAYVSYVSAATQPLSSPDASPPHSREMCGGGLATLHEGQELSAGSGCAAGVGAAAVGARLTHDALIATQTRRLHSDVAPHRKRSVYSAHVSYAGYTPASRQDSERASLSSGRTDSDAVSLSGSSVDGMSMRGAREGRESRHRPRLYGLDRSLINKEQDTAMMIPRTQRVQSEQLRVLPPAEFAPLLIEKLERVKREQENKERLERRLAEKNTRHPDDEGGIYFYGVRCGRRTGNGGTATGGSTGSKSSGASGGGGGGSSHPTGGDAHTVVVVSFLDESVPYRFKVPAAPLTLRVFKDYLPRKGNYRYFFKTECADLDNTVIQEEVSSDNETLPMFEGKVMARVKSIE